jgi:hypothetical protein
VCGRGDGGGAGGGGVCERGYACKRKRASVSSASARVFDHHLLERGDFLDGRRQTLFLNVLHAIQQHNGDSEAEWLPHHDRLLLMLLLLLVVQLVELLSHQAGSSGGQQGKALCSASAGE